MCSAFKLSLLLTTIIVVMVTDSKPRLYQSISDTSSMKYESLKENNSLDKNETEVNHQISYKKEETYYEDMAQDFNESLNYSAPVFKYPTTSSYRTQVSIPIGNSTKLECLAEGDPYPIIKWFMNRRTASDLRTGYRWDGVSYLEPFDDKWVVDIENFTKNDIGNYTCFVCNKKGCIQRSVVLEDILTEQINPFAPRPKYDNLIQLMVNRARVNFHCEAEGKPPPTITWHMNNITHSINWTDLSYSESDWLLAQLRMSDQGNYTCVACNELGCIEQTIAIRIDENNVIDLDSGVRKGYPRNVTVVEQQTATFSCPLATYENLDDFFITWSKLSKKDKWIVFKDSEMIEIRPTSWLLDAPVPTLTIDNATKDDEGWYECFINTKSWQTKSRAFLQVIEVQPPPTKRSWVIPTLVTVFGAILFMVVVVVISVCMKLQKERRQKQLALEMGAEVFEILWKKKVTVQKPQLSDSIDADRPLLTPVVKIEKLKVTSQRNDADYSMVMSEYELPIDNDWEKPRETFVLDKVLGEGEFGKVVKAKCTLQGEESVVAVKMLKEEHTDADMKALVSEMEIMKLVGKHENIINLLGCCTQNGPLYVVIEFASYGCLREFLRKRRPGNESELASSDLEGNRKLTQKDLISFSYQVAKGMEYLASRQCIHRDLAARNVLVSDAWVLKIADFGLARDVQDSNYYMKKTAGKLPARWMAPESLHKMIFTVKTDVWSFGVLMWEIMTLGATPYPTVKGQYLYEHLRAGHRLDKPPGCRFNLYMLMLECWSLSPRGRPSFTKLAENLDEILTLTSQEISQTTSDRLID